MKAALAAFGRGLLIGALLGTLSAAATLRRRRRRLAAMRAVGSSWAETHRALMGGGCAHVYREAWACDHCGVVRTSIAGEPSDGRVTGGRRW